MIPGLPPRRPLRRIKIVCLSCKKEREYIPYLAKKRKYCSITCKMNHYYDTKEIREYLNIMGGEDVQVRISRI
jgi:hypothetical protein